MEAIRQIPFKDIPSILVPTAKAFTPLLLANKSAILSIPSSTHQYGPHPRQTLDIYNPPPTSSTSTNPPILIFLYGGGLIRGDKIVPGVPEKLVYHNLGSFFASHGFTTIIPDYRRVNAPKLGTGEDATFPSGAEDLSLVLSYLSKPKTTTPRDVFIMGNSAGGVHTGTWLLHDPFKSQRLSLLSSDSNLTLRGVILLSVPCDMTDASDVRLPINAAYWPITLSNSSAAQKAGHSEAEFGLVGLLKSLPSGVQPAEIGIPPVLMVEGSLDPEDEILDTMERFKREWKEKFGGLEGYSTLIMEGHNHISPPFGLLCGEEEAEKWGVDVVGWCRGLL